MTLTTRELALEICDKAGTPDLVSAVETVLNYPKCFTCIHDGDTRYTVRTEELAEWEAANGPISGDKYEDFCNAVPYVLPTLGTPGNIGQIELYAALLDLGANSRSF